MAVCVNRNDPNFKALEKLYGANLADMFTRTYSIEKKLLPKNEFYIPTNKEFLEWFKSSKENIFRLVDYSLLQNPRLSKKAIEGMLKGVVHKLDGSNYITTGWSNRGTLLIRAEAVKSVYGPNLRLIEALAKNHPDTFEIVSTKYATVKVIKIKAPDSAAPVPKQYPDAKIREKYFNKGNVEKTSVILNRIADSAHPLNEVAKNLLKFVRINNPDIELVDVEYFENVSKDVKRSSGYYSPTENKIYIAKKASVNHGLSEKLLLHEIMHGLSYWAVRENTTSAANFQKLYEAAVQRFNKYDPKLPKSETNKHYGTYDIDEFMVALFTDGEFIRDLQTLPPVDGIKYSNFLEEILDYIVSLLKLNTSPNLYQQSMSVASEILDTELSRAEMMEQFYNSQDDVMLQKTDDATLPSSASPKTLALIKDFLKQIGVDIKTLQKITVNGVTHDANGVAQLMQKLISVVEGKEAQALPEEAMHFAVAIIKQTKPELYQKLLKEINSYDMLDRVFKTYSSDPAYQINGKPDVIKLKEEAIAKVLVEKIINQVDGVNERPENLKKVQSWWKTIKDWIRELMYRKSGFDQAAIDIISGKKIGSVEDIREEEDALFLQKSKQDAAYENLVSVSKRMDKKTNSQGVERYYIDGVEIPKRVSDFLKENYDSKMKGRDLLTDEYDKAVDDLRKEKGTAGHLDLEHLFHLFVDQNGYLKSPEIMDYNLERDNYTPNIGNRVMYEALAKNMKDRLLSYPEGTRFLSEIMFYDGKNVGGTMDFIAITPDGKINISDWKFVNLNTEKYKDIPWYKVEAWNNQMDYYKKMLEKNYGVQPKDFGQTRMIPIVTKYSKGKKDKQGKVIELPKLIDLKIGDVDVKNISEEEDYLLPVPTKDESSDNAELDELIKKLNAAYERFRDEKVLPSQRDDKRDQINALFKAIRRLRVKRDVKPLVEQMGILMNKVNNFYLIYENKYKDPEDASKFTEKEIDDFSLESESLIKALNNYRDIHLLLGDIVEGDMKNKLRDMSDEVITNLNKINKIDQDFSDKIIATREKVDNILSPEKVIKGFTKWFASTSTLQVKSIQLLFKKAQKALTKASYMTQEENNKLLNIRDDYMKWAKSKNLTQQDMFSMIKKKDDNKLIDQYEQEFYKSLSKAIAEKDITWIKNNVDIDKVKEAINKKQETEIERIRNKGRYGDPEKVQNEISREINDAKKLYSVESDTSNGWFIKEIVRKFPLDKWETKEWKNITARGNEPLKAFYDYIIEKNTEYAELGYISRKQSRVFLPYIQGSVVEAVVKGEKLGLGERFWKSISIDESDVGYGQLDPETGRPINTIPKYFTTEFKGQLSEDLFKTMSLYNEAALRYKYLSEIENQVRAIARVERNKKSILTSNLGNVKRDKNDNILFEPEGTPGNYELLDSMIKSIVYGQKYVDNQNFDAALINLGKWGKTINEKIGINVFPEDLDRRLMTINKVVDNLNNSFQITTLGLNLGSSISNLFGGTAQSIINSGKYFTKTDFISAETQLLVNKFNGLDKNKYLKAFEYFLPLTDNYNADLANRLSVNTVSAEDFQNFLMFLMRKADRTVQGANFLAFLNNSIVIDGRVVNAREYLRSLPEYKSKYEGSTEDRKAFEEKFDKDVKKLIEEKGVMKLSTVVDGKFVIPGVDRLSDSIIDLRTKVQQLSKDAMGNLSDTDVRTINMTILGKSFMVFKNWIPRLVDTRFGGLKYNAASDAYEWGRMRTIMNIIHDRMLGSFKTFYDVFVGNDDGLKVMRESFEKKAEQYELETGRKLEMDEALYLDLYRSNVKAAATDLTFLLSLFAMITALGFYEPDDEEDPAVINQYRFITRLADKLRDELMYFYNPTSILNLVGSGPFPAMSLINNGSKAIMNFFREMYGIGIGDEEMVKENKVIKYAMRTFPFTNQMVSYLPLFYPELAKDLGIRVQSNYGIR